MQEISDADLIKKYLYGQDSEALNELIRRYFRAVFLFAKTFVKLDQEAEDITQEVFVKAWKNLKKFDREKKFKTWIFQITKNTCIDYFRKNRNILPSGSLDEEQMENSLEQMTDSGPQPDEIFDSLYFTQKLEEIIRTLPESYRLTVVLHLQQQMTFEEISQVLTQPINTVKSRYRRALLFVRKNIS